jgi:proteasome lid subunit RPN8/RPN11
LLFLRDYDETEVGGFGITSADDLLLIEDFQLVRQTCTWAHVAFDDESVADFFDEQVDEGRKPEQFARIWLHTHPGDCPNPSGVDEETFDRVFGASDWAVMFILAQEGKSYARLRFNIGPGADLRMNVDIDYSNPFPACTAPQWEEEYLENVHPEISRSKRALNRNRSPAQIPESANNEPADDIEWETDWPESWLEYCGFEDGSLVSIDEPLQ